LKEAFVTELRSQQINRVISVVNARATGAVQRFGGPSLVREAVREAERATHRLRVERDIEARQRKRCELDLEQGEQAPVVDTDTRAVLVKDHSETGGAAAPRLPKRTAIELKLAIEGHTRRMAALDQAIADAVLRIRLLSEPEIFLVEQGQPV